MSLESQPRLRVLLVDDEHKLTDLLRLELDVEGYDVDVASDGASGLIRSRTEPTPDLIILDWNLPDFSGIDICQRIRAGGITIPILMLTGHDEITDRVKALDAGVDDYLIKPFSIDELMARLRAMHRRAETFSGPVGGSDVNEILKVADLSMNTRTRDVMRGDRAIRLSVKEYDLLNFLMRGAGRVLERQEIMHGVWGRKFLWGRQSSRRLHPLPASKSRTGRCANPHPHRARCRIHPQGTIELTSLFRAESLQLWARANRVQDCATPGPAAAKQDPCWHASPRKDPDPLNQRPANRHAMVCATRNADAALC